jgi:hypothetical protein
MRRSVLGLCAALVAGCNGPTDLKRPAGSVDVSVEFCVGQGPGWFAYRNEGADWIAVPASVFQSKYVFPATPKVQVAYARLIPLVAISQLFVLNLAADEVQMLRCPTGAAGSKRLDGMVKTINANDDARVLMGNAVSFLFPGMTTYSLFVREGPLDLFALIRPFPTTSTAAPPLVIVRHGIDLQEGAALPLLDFTAPDALPFVSSRVAVQGLAGNATVTGRVNYVSARGTDFSIGTFLSQLGTLTLASVPGALLGPDDLHRVALTQTSGTVTNDIVFFQHAAKDTSVAFGPPLSAQSVDVIESAPMLRPRVRFGAQAEYPSLARAVFQQSEQTAFRSFTIHKTAAYGGGTPATWDLDIPDLSAVEGFESAWALKPATPTTIGVQVWKARAALYFGAGRATPGETMRAVAATMTTTLVP